MAHVERRRTRDREGTERALLAAARRLIMRDGVLAGLSLSDVSDEAGVNRRLIYQYFGTRQELLRAAIAERHRAVRESLHATGHFDLDFAERYIHSYEALHDFADTFKLEALAILDGDDSVKLFPFLNASLEAFRRDIQAGRAHEEDATIVHTFLSNAIRAHWLFREKTAGELGIDLDELDQRVGRVLRRMLDCLGKSAHHDTPKDDLDDHAHVEVDDGSS